jgi:hypothetical protein
MISEQSDVRFVFIPICFVRVYILFLFFCICLPILVSSMIFIKDDARVTSGAGTVCSSGAPEFASSF